MTTRWGGASTAGGGRTRLRTFIFLCLSTRLASPQHGVCTQVDARRRARAGSRFFRIFTHYICVIIPFSARSHRGPRAGVDRLRAHAHKLAPPAVPARQLSARTPIRRQTDRDSPETTTVHLRRAPLNKPPDRLRLSDSTHSDQIPIQRSRQCGTATICASLTPLCHRLRLGVRRTVPAGTVCASCNGKLVSGPHTHTHTHTRIHAQHHAADHTASHHTPTTPARQGRPAQHAPVLKQSLTASTR